MAIASALDFKLGIRMLRRYPGLSFIGGLALAVAIAIGVLAFQFAHDQLTPTLPLDEGDRIVRLENFDRLAGATEPRVLFDYQQWRGALKGVHELGASRTVERNLVLPNGPPQLVAVAEMTPNGFAVTRVLPMLGRTLAEADLSAGAPDVVVIGYDLWQRHLRGDPAILGKTVQLGATRAEVIGIMPKGFAFPRSQQAWLPLRDVASKPGDGPPVLVFGRLGAGATLESAQVEMETMHTRLLPADTAYRKHLQPRVVPFANVVLPVSTHTVMLAMFAAVFVVLLGVSANVATLMFARTALRESEIVVRATLGATRRRILGQLLAESLVLSTVAAIAGVLIAQGVMRFVWYQQVVVRQEPQPFWRDADLAPATLLWAIGLALIGAVLVGLLPGLKATRTDVRGALARSAADASGMRFGGVWSFVIIAQVAFSVLTLPIAIGTTQEMRRDGGVRPFQPQQYVAFEAQYDAAGGARLEGAYTELERRLLADPIVSAVTRASALPGTDYRMRRMVVQRGTEAPVVVRGNVDGMVLSSQVDLGFFDAFALPIVAGRAFTTADVGTPVVVINEALARRLGGNPLGLRLRDVAVINDSDVESEPGAWLAVVGVVTNAGMVPTDGGEAEMIYQAVAPTALNPVQFAVRVRGTAGALAARIPQMAADVDPALRVYRALPFDEVLRRRALPGRLAYAGVISVIALAVALSAAGSFALMSVAVQRRTREIGIRVALGASSRGVLRALFSRAAVQLGVGILLGNGLVLGVRVLVVGADNLTSLLPSMLGISLLMTLVGIAACAVPGWRALRVQPMDAIRSNG